MIVIIDYKTGNTGSLSNMFNRIGVEALISAKPADIEKADKLVLPGVGAFDEGMENLKNSGLIPIITDRVINNNVPILGICLGMQLFGKKSEEGKSEGLGWIDASAVKIKPPTGSGISLKIPHMGWNEIKILKNNPIFQGIENGARFYFVHSYHLKCDNLENILAVTEYGQKDFVSVVGQNNIIGVQFHPEKSHKFGMKLLSNFSKL